MLDTAIIGGGLCGLALARSLQQQGRTFALFEARDRLGGRILSVPDGDGMALDLGPTWYWPQTQPRIASLVAELGLAAFPQHDQGTVLSLPDPDKKPKQLEAKEVHEGAQRLAGGMSSLVQALAADLPADALHLAHALIAVVERGDHVELHFRYGGITLFVAARQVVLSVPPRILDEQVRFEPALADAIRQTLRATPTWMAAQAKVAVTYPRPFWRETGLSGNAFASHEQAVLGEVFDACNATGDQAALGGFFALSPSQRVDFQVGIPLLISSQLVQLFGSVTEHGTQHMQDWATEAYTCSALDRPALDSHPAYDDPALRKPCWNGKLHFCGSETASYAAGYLEGALEAGERVMQQLADENKLPHKTSSSALRRSS